MPYLIEKSCGTRTPVDMTADEARYRAQSVRVIEVADDGTEIGDVNPEDSESAELPAASASVLDAVGDVTTEQLKPYADPISAQVTAHPPATEAEVVRAKKTSRRK